MICYGWNCIDDENIYSFNQDNLENEAFGGGIDSTKNAYLLIYERKALIELEIDENKDIFHVSTFNNLFDVEQCVKKSQRVWNDILNDNKLYKYGI